jgi:serine protease Do
MRPFRIIAVLLIIPTIAQADEAYDRAVGSVVSVMAIKPGGKMCLGTGVVMAGGIVTANHVIEGAEDIAVIFPVRDGTRVIGDPLFYKGEKHIKLCKVIATDSKRDLALIRMENPAKAQPIGIGESPSPGDPVFIIGAAASGPGMWHHSPGNVRQVYEGSYPMDEGKKASGRIIETNILANHGDSGSPILNKDGELVGIMLGGDAPTNNRITRGMDVSEVIMFMATAIVSDAKGR